MNNLELDHRVLKTKLGTVGTGLMEAGGQFKSPVTYGDKLTMRLTLAEWQTKSLRVEYRGTSAGRLILDGFEVRGLFQKDDKTRKIHAAEIAPLRELIEAANVPL